LTDNESSAIIVSSRGDKKEERVSKMTVKELREMLAQFDENMEVKIVDDNWNEPIYDVDEYDGVILISA